MNNRVNVAIQKSQTGAPLHIGMRKTAIRDDLV